MIFYKNSKWNMCTEKVHYTQHGKEITQYVSSEGHDWWVDFADRWEHTEIIEFITVKPTDKQLKRLEEVNKLNIGEGFGILAGDYVKEGVFPEDVNHPLRDLQIRKEQELQDSYLLDLEFRQSIKELEV